MSEQPAPFDPGVIELAGRINDRGQTALAAAVFTQSTDTVRHLVAAGADPDAGQPSARATAPFSQLPEMAALLDQPRP